ncbi:MAG: oxalate---CoA ligase, partial [Ilumatobacteraceae bacterium]
MADSNATIDSTPATDTVAALLAPDATGPALLTVDDEAMDHPALRGEVERLAEQLRSAGLRANDRIAIVLPNGPEMALVLLAAMSVGCAAPLNPKYREDEFRFYLDDLHAAALLTIDGATPAAHAAAPAGTIAIDVRGSGLSIDLVAPPATTSGGSSAQRPAADDQALVLHTSGTTSRPKIVPLRQRNLAWSARNIAAALQLTPADRSLNVMPLFHIHGIMAGLLAPLSAGAAVV